MQCVLPSDKIIGILGNTDCLFCCTLMILQSFLPMVWYLQFEMQAAVSFEGGHFTPHRQFVTRLYEQQSTKFGDNSSMMPQV